VDVGESYNDPLQFVECCQLAENYGFDTIWFGDHFLPWAHSGNKSAFVWSVMPAALERTKRITIGPNVTCPIGGRFHPAIIAQAAATIDNMYPGRFMLGVGFGEAMNEARFFASGWPKWHEKIERLAEVTVLMRKLWENQDYFSFEGMYFNMKDVFLYTKPKTRIRIFFSAIGRKAASYSGKYGDNLVTINTPERCRNVIFPAFEEAARKAGKDPSRMEKMAHLETYFTDAKKGVDEVRRSGDAGILVEGAFEEQDPRKIEEMGTAVSDEKILENKYFVSSPEELIEHIDRYRKAGATRVYLVTNSFPKNIQFVGEKILPHFMGERKK
jgi:G6PDH family F420-dependent oxidoreductase